MATWGKRNHNPGCVLGKSYATDYDGYLGLIRTLQQPIYADCTAFEIFSTYAPAGDGANDPVAYANHVINWLNNTNHNVGWDTKLNLKDPNLLKDLLPAISQMECGEVLSGEQTAQMAVNDWASGKVDLGPGRGPNDIVERVYPSFTGSASAALARAVQNEKKSYLTALYYNSLHKLGYLNPQTAPKRYLQYQEDIIDANNVPNTKDGYTRSSLQAVAKTWNYIQKHKGENPALLSQKVFALIGRQMAPYILNKDSRCTETIAKMTFTALCELHQEHLGRGLTPKELETIQKNTATLMENAHIDTNPKAFLAYCQQVLTPMRSARKGLAGTRRADTLTTTLAGHAANAGQEVDASGQIISGTYQKPYI